MLVIVRARRSRVLGALAVVSGFAAAASCASFEVDRGAGTGVDAAKGRSCASLADASFVCDDFAVAPDTSRWRLAGAAAR